MQRIRLRRVGRKNEPHYQVVVAPHTNPVKGSFIAKLGWYNPQTKELKVDKEAVLEWVNKGAKPSNTMAKLLIAQGIKHKNIVFVKDAPGKPKVKEADGKAKAPVAPKEEAPTPQSKTGGTEPRPESVGEKAPEVTDEKVGADQKTDKKTTAPTPRQDSGGQESRPENVEKTEKPTETENQPKEELNNQKDNNQEEAK